MKKLLFTALAFTMLFVTSCQEERKAPKGNSTKRQRD